MFKATITIYKQHYQTSTASTNFYNGKFENNCQQQQIIKKNHCNIEKEEEKVFWILSECHIWMSYMNESE